MWLLMEELVLMIRSGKNNTQGQVMQNIAHSIKGFMDDSEKGRKTNIDRELDENKYRKRNNGRSDGLSR